MPNSMTGFGRGTAEDEERRLTVEIKSVNNRFLDIQIRMPRELSALELFLRQACQKRLSRGKVDITVSWTFLKGSNREITADLGLVQSYAQAIRSIANEVTASFDFSIDPYKIAVFPDVIRVQEASLNEAAWQALLEQAAAGAIDQLIAMRAEEGQRLSADILEKTARLKELRLEILGRAPQVVQDYRDRLKVKLHELLAEQTEEIFTESRLAAEVLVFADKAAVDEELVRLDSHLETLSRQITESGETGKKLDFLMQEINREINTIGSKANDLEVTRAVVEMKTVLEKIREQVQNIE